MSGESEYWKTTGVQVWFRKEETANWTEGNQQSLIIWSKVKMYNLKVEKPDERKVRTDWKKSAETSEVQKYSIKKHQSVVHGNLKMVVMFN